MSKRFLTYNTEDAGKVPVNSQGIIDPEKIPCYDSRDIRTVTYTFDGNLEGKEYVEDGDGNVFVKVSDEFPEPSSIVRIVSLEKEGSSESLDHYVNEYDSEGGESPSQIIGDNAFNICNGLGIYAASDLEANNGYPALAKGFYLMAVVSDDYLFYTSKLDVAYRASGELKKLDEKFLPEPALVVKIMDVDNMENNGDVQYAASHTPLQIYKALLAGKSVFAIYKGVIYRPNVFYEDNVTFQYIEISESSVCQLEFQLVMGFNGNEPITNVYHYEHEYHPSV